jgi:RNA 3'-terminal phosphate cyclase-like protein
MSTLDVIQIVTFSHSLQPLSITLKGLTNDHLDPSVDVIRTVTLPLLKRLGIEDNGLELKVS